MNPDYWTMIKVDEHREILKSNNNKCIVFVATNADGKAETSLITKWYELTDELVPNAIIASNVDDMPSTFYTEHYIGRSFEMLFLDMIPFAVVISGQDSLMDFVMNKLVLKYEDAVQMIMDCGLDNAEQYTEQMKEYSIKLFHYCRNYSIKHGLSLKTAKFRFGVDGRGKLRVAGEICTPNSADFYDKDGAKITTSTDCYRILFS